MECGTSGEIRFERRKLHAFVKNDGFPNLESSYFESPAR